LLSSDNGAENGVYETVHQLFVDFKKVYDSVRREVLYNILFRIPMKIVRLNKMCLNETYGRTYPIQNGVKQGDALSPLLFKLLP
jgi:hypothetical protein